MSPASTHAAQLAAWRRIWELLLAPDDAGAEHEEGSGCSPSPEETDPDLCSRKELSREGL